MKKDSKEIEVKFLDIDKEKIRKKLLEIGFEMTKPETLMHRVIFNYPVPVEKKWARLRDEGDKITLTIKDWTAGGDYAREIEINVSDYEKAREIICEFGLELVMEQESRREIWEKSSIEISIDSWPKIPTFIEIESDSVEKIKKVSKELGFDFSVGLFCSVGNVYEHYGLDIDEWKNLKFYVDKN